MKYFAYLVPLLFLISCYSNVKSTGQKSTCNQNKDTEQITNQVSDSESVNVSPLCTSQDTITVTSTLSSYKYSATPTSITTVKDCAKKSSQKHYNVYSEKDTATVEFTYSYKRTQRLDYNTHINISYVDTMHSYQIDESDFYYNHQRTRPYVTATQGEATVSFRISKSGEMLSSGEFTIPLRRDWRRSIGFFIENYNPIQYCWG